MHSISAGIIAQKRWAPDAAPRSGGLDLRPWIVNSRSKRKLAFAARPAAHDLTATQSHSDHSLLLRRRGTRLQKTIPCRGLFDERNSTTRWSFPNLKRLFEPIRPVPPAARWSPLGCTTETHGLSGSVRQETEEKF